MRKVTLFPIKQSLKVMFFLLAITNQAIAIPVSTDDSARSMVEEDGSGTPTGIYGDGGNASANGAGLSNGDFSNGSDNVPESGNANDFADQGAGAGEASSGMDSGSDSGESNSYLVNGDLLSRQKSLESLKNAFAMTSKEIADQVADLLSKQSTLSQQIQNIAQDIKNDDKTIDDQQKIKKNADENTSTITSNLTKIERTEIELLTQLAPLKEKVNSLVSDIRKIQEAKQQQTTLAETNKRQSTNASDTISTSRFDSQTKKVQLSELQSQINEITNKVQHLQTLKEQQTNTYKTTVDTITQEMLDIITKHGVGVAAQCSPDVHTITKSKSDTLDKVVDVPIEAQAVETRIIEAKCENLCSHPCTSV